MKNQQKLFFNQHIRYRSEEVTRTQLVITRTEKQVSVCCDGYRQEGDACPLRRLTFFWFVTRYSNEDSLFLVPIVNVYKINEESLFLVLLLQRLHHFTVNYAFILRLHHHFMVSWDTSSNLYKLWWFCCHDCIYMRKGCFFYSSLFHLFFFFSTFCIFQRYAMEVAWMENARHRTTALATQDTQDPTVEMVSEIFFLFATEDDYQLKVETFFVNN